MRTTYSAIVFGGGVDGVFGLYHLTKSGWANLVQIERPDLPGGPTRYRAAKLHAANARPNAAAQIEAILFNL